MGDEEHVGRVGYPRPIGNRPFAALTETLRSFFTPKSCNAIEANTSRVRESRRNIHSSIRSEAGGCQFASRSLRLAIMPFKVARGWVRKLSSIAVWCTQEMVQNGAQPFGFAPSRTISSRVYCASGIAGRPRCCEQ